MIKNISNYRKIWILLGVLSLLVSGFSIINYEIYNQVVSKEILPGTISQDIITVIVGLLTIYIGLTVDTKSYKKQIFGLSFVAYLFYGYGIYVIEQLYTPLYLIYMLIFGLSFWTLTFCVKDLKYENLKKLFLSKILTRISLFFSIFIPTLFYLIWTTDLIELIEKGTKLEFTFSVYILDMIFIMPAFLIIAYLISKKHKVAYVFIPVMFFKSFTLLFSVGLGSFIRIYFNMAGNFQEGLSYIALSLVFLGISIAVINNTKWVT